MELAAAGKDLNQSAKRSEDSSFALRSSLRRMLNSSFGYSGRLGKELQAENRDGVWLKELVLSAGCTPGSGVSEAGEISNLTVGFCW